MTAYTPFLYNTLRGYVPNLPSTMFSANDIERLVSSRFSSSSLAHTSSSSPVTNQVTYPEIPSSTRNSFLQITYPQVSLPYAPQASVSESNQVKESLPYQIGVSLRSFFSDFLKGLLGRGSNKT